MPQSPAFTVLGLTPKAVQRPINVRSLSFDLLNGIDYKGNYQTGVALDFSPYQIAKGSSTYLSDYRSSFWTRFLWNMDVSFATSKGLSEEDKSQRLAPGILFTLFDRGDYRTLRKPKFDEEGKPVTDSSGRPIMVYVLDEQFNALDEELYREPLRVDTLDLDENEIKEASKPGKSVAIVRKQKARALVLEQLANPSKETVLTKEQAEAIRSIVDEKTKKERVETEVLRVFKEQEEVRLRNQEAISKYEEAGKRAQNKFFEKLAKMNWNRSKWQIGYAPAYRSPDSNLGNLYWEGEAFWTSFAYGFEGNKGLQDNSQLVIHARRRTNESVPDSKNKGKFFDQDSSIYALQLRSGSNAFAWSLESGYSDTRRNGKQKDDFWQFTVGAEYRLSKDQWLAFTIGSTSGMRDGNTLAFGVNFNIGLNSSAGIGR